MSIIKAFIDKSLKFAEEHREYLMYQAYYEEQVDPEMLELPDFDSFSSKPDKIFITQTDRTSALINIGTEKDQFWKAADNNLCLEDIALLEKDLKVVLPKSYKEYLMYKHHYKLFLDIDIQLYPKPIKTWREILVERNKNAKEIFTLKNYLSIGNYSDYGELALKLGDSENEEKEVVFFDYETAEIGEKLAINFTTFLSNQLELCEPQFRELKEWEKKLNK